MMLAKPIVRSLCLLLLATCSLTSLASERGTSQQAKQMLENATMMIQERGAEDAFITFNDPQGGFVQNDLYIFAISMDGTYKASGANPHLMGQSLANVSDASGKPIGEEIIKLADRIGYGIIEYDWLNRKSNAIEHKFTRIKKVGDYIIGVGFYLPETAQ